jgi:glycosyltransferase involved in cell wall biosynthesis
MKRVLMVAYHFPPLAGSSGIQRTLRFVQHLPRFGWEPAVLTVHPRAYERTSPDLASEVGDDVLVKRAYGLDTARHLSIAGRYPGILARPDRWMTWQYDAGRAGMRLIRDWHPDVIWSTYPIATAHLIGETLHRRSGLPWIADFRDPMAQEGYPADPRVWQHFKRIEEAAVTNARFSVFTTPGAARVYRARYPRSADRIMVLENGFDEETFAGLAESVAGRQPLNPGSVTLLHSGIVYPSERDPSHLMSALRLLCSVGSLRRSALRIRFRAAGHEALLTQLARANGVEDMIEILPPVPYRAALEEMLSSDGLLVLQATNCNEQIPAKLYEYLRVGRPILALTDPQGDTAGVMREAGLDTVAPLNAPREIAALLERFVSDVGSLPVPSPAYVAGASRGGRAQALVRLLERAAEKPLGSAEAGESARA